MLKELTDFNFDIEIASGLKPVEFYAPWCKYCNDQQIILEEMSNDGIWIGKVDSEKYPLIAQRFSISAFPSFVIFKNGKTMTQFAGYHTKSSLLKQFLKYM